MYVKSAYQQFGAKKEQGHAKHWPIDSRGTTRGVVTIGAGRIEPEHKWLAVSVHSNQVYQIYDPNQIL